MGNKVCDLCLTMILKNLIGGDLLYYQNSAMEWGIQKTVRLLNISNYLMLELIP